MFIFSADTSLAFANKPAKNIFPKTTNFNDLINRPINDIIKQQSIASYTLTINENKIYSFVIRGSIELDGAGVYGSDISEGINLNKA